ncbi:MAG: HIT domain-containing protein [Rickettsiales bacterium]|nr:HIT domain-containing protein [Rickettsiales bacterium]
MEKFSLNSRLKADTIKIAEFELSELLLMNDKNYPWFILVPRRSNISEIFQLNDQDQTQLYKEISYLAEILQQFYRADKVNIGALGNMVPQLHIHVIMRFKNDIAWPKPVWGLFDAINYSDEEITQISKDINGLIKTSFLKTS